MVILGLNTNRTLVHTCCMMVPFAPADFITRKSSLNLQGNWICAHFLCYFIAYGSMGDQNFSLVGYDAASSGNSLPTFRDNISAPSSRVSIPKSNQ